jgi:hypothetical protein
MTQLILKNDINALQRGVLLQLLQSWNIEAETLPAATPVEAKKPAATNDDPLARIRGMWADRDIDAKELRKQAWGYDRRTKNYDTL